MWIRILFFFFLKEDLFFWMTRCCKKLQHDRTTVLVDDSNAVLLNRGKLEGGSITWQQALAIAANNTTRTRTHTIT